MGGMGGGDVRDIHIQYQRSNVVLVVVITVLHV